MTTNQPSENRHSLHQLPDETAIQFLAAQFSDAANRRDAGLFQEVWAPEGVWEIGPPVNVRSEGRGQMGAFLLHMLDQWDFFVQLTTSGVVAVSGERAKARFYINEIARSKTGKGNYNLSFYEDELIKTAGKWYFTRRSYHTIYQAAPLLDGQVQPIPVLPD